VRLAVLIGILGLVACAPRKPPAAAPVETPVRMDDGGLRARAVGRTAFAIPIISEEDFRRLTLAPAGEIGPITDGDRTEAARAVALANGATVLGVAGRVQKRTRVNAPVFFVARDAVMTAQGTVESTDFFVAAVPLSGEVQWTALRSALLSGPTLTETAPRALEGCAPLYAEGDTPLPQGVVLNLESRRRPRNASQQTIELSFGTAPGPGFAESRFVCGEPVLAERPGGGPAPIETAAMPEFESALPLPDDAVVISEADFYRALSASDALEIPKEAKASAAQLAAAASERTALGLQGQLSDRKSFETSFVVVARNVTRAGERLGIGEFYFVPVRLSGNAEWVGDRLRLGFHGGIPPFNFAEAPCGLAYMPTRGDPGCAGGRCIDAPHPWMGVRGGGGSLPGGSRPTVRLFGKSGNTLDLRAIACTQFLRPPEREAWQCGRTDSGNRAPEICNGRDDDCNRLVDDGGVCDVLPMVCPGVPRACGSITCGEIPDGLGGVVPCGGPCP
jgi:hypothetical protein